MFSIMFRLDRSDIPITNKSSAGTMNQLDTKVMRFNSTLCISDEAQSSN